MPLTIESTLGYSKPCEASEGGEAFELTRPVAVVEVRLHRIRGNQGMLHREASGIRAAFPLNSKECACARVGNWPHCWFNDGQFLIVTYT